MESIHTAIFDGYALRDLGGSIELLHQTTQIDAWHDLFRVRAMITTDTDHLPATPAPGTL